MDQARLTVCSLGQPDAGCATSLGLFEGGAACWYDSTASLSMECGVCCAGIPVPEPAIDVLMLAALLFLLVAHWLDGKRGP